MGMAYVYSPRFKTIVYKTGKTWIVSYHDGIGASWRGFDTWQRAWVEAIEIETRKSWR